MQAGRPYFHLDFKDPPNLLYGIRGNFPLQFGRLVAKYQFEYTVHNCTYDMYLCHA